MSLYDELMSQISIVIQEKTDDKVKEIMSNLRQETPVRTGFLLASWDYTKEGDNYIITNTAPYAGYVNNYNRFIDRGLDRSGYGGGFSL